MITEERRARIVSLLRDHGHVRVPDLSRQFAVSEVTVRHDLQALHKRGLLFRSHGGATLSHAAVSESPLLERQARQGPSKERIGTAAAGLVQDGETIILDSGTTTQQIARHLRGKQGLHVITNGINVAMELLGVRGIELIIIGGMLRDDSVSVVGHFAEQMLEQFSADRLFLGTSACDLEFGVSTPNLAESRVNQAMVRIAKQTVLVTDSSKFNKRSLCRIVAIEDLDIVITDAGVPDAFSGGLRKAGVEVVIA